MKYVFKQVDSWTPSETTVEFEADSLETILQQFELFLRGSGYFFEGNLEIVNDTDDDIFNDGEDHVLGDDDEDYSDLIDQLDEIKKSWPFPIERPPEAEDNSQCPVCKLSYKVMEGNQCYDANCPRKD